MLKNQQLCDYYNMKCKHIVDIDERVVRGHYHLPQLRVYHQPCTQAHSQISTSLTQMGMGKGDRVLQHIHLEHFPSMT